MPAKNKKGMGYELHSLFRRNWVYVIIAGVFAVISAFLNVHFAFFEILIVAGMVVYESFRSAKHKKVFLQYVEELGFCLNGTTAEEVIHFPAPMAITSVGGSINWYNREFTDMIGQTEILDRLIQDLIPDIQLSKFIEGNGAGAMELNCGDRRYMVTGQVISDRSDTLTNNLLALYFIDKTEECAALRLREEERMVECIVIIDNYDEVLKETPDTNHGTLIGEIEHMVNEWVASGRGVSRKYENGKFLVLFEERCFAEILSHKFDILNKVREINLQNKIPVTLSIGVGRLGADFEENDRFARLALDMALGRGGDQAVLKDAEGFSFYGAKTREVEKKTKVRARVVAHALRELIDQSDKVVIMGHTGGDMDSLGAAIGLFRAVKNRRKNAFIVLNKAALNAKQMLQMFEKIPEYDEGIITGEQALNLYDHNTLVIVVDTHRPSSVETPELLKQASDIVLIDHHRRGEEFLDNAVLSYHEPYASSTCEMVTEILQYIQENEKLSVREAEALYTGIFMDTKGFTFKTGVRTFEAAAYLRRLGVDTIEVRRMMRSDLDMYIKKAEIIRSAQIYRENIAISYFDSEHKDLQIIVAQAADELLNINGIEAAFVLARSNGRVIISGRSLDNVNVQVILEKLGGGGHITIAGAQLEQCTLNIAEQMLKDAIDEVMSEDEAESKMEQMIRLNS